MKNNKNKLNPHFFRKMSNGLDIALMFYKTRLNPQQTQKGNTLLIGIGFGLLVMLLGGLAIAKANNNKINATSNEFTQKSLAITQAGVNNLMAQLNQGSNKSLLLLNNDTHPYLGCTGDECNQWADADQGLSYSGEVNSCSSSASTTSQSIQGVASAQSVGAGNGAGEFKLLAYLFQDGNGNTDPADAPNTGTLLVEGNVTSSTDSKSRFEVQIPVTVAKSGTGGTGNAIMAEKMEVGTPDLITGGVTCTEPANCEIECDGNPTPSVGQLKAAIGVENGGIVNDAITVGGSSVPDLQNVPEGVTVNLLTPCELGDGSPCNDTLVLPRVGDIASSGTYYYQENTGAELTNSIGINTNDQVRIYLSGDITYGGGDFITRANSSGDLDFANFPASGQIRIYGGTISVSGSQSQATPNVTAAPTATWDINANACLHGLIHAPNVYITYGGGGNSNACNGFGAPYDSTTFYGVIWVKGFGAQPPGSNNQANNAQTLEFNVDSTLLTTVITEYGTDAFGPKVVTMGAGSTITRKEAN